MKNKITLTILLVLLALCARADNWTNYPFAAYPDLVTNDWTFLLGSVRVKGNEQVDMPTMLQLTKTNAQAGMQPTNVNLTGWSSVATNSFLQGLNLSVSTHVKLDVNTNLISSEDATGYTNLITAPAAGHTNVVIERIGGAMDSYDLATLLANGTGGGGGGGSGITSFILNGGLNYSGALGPGFEFSPPFSLSQNPNFTAFSDAAFPVVRAVTLTNAVVVFTHTTLGAGTNCIFTVYTNGVASGLSFTAHGDGSATKFIDTSGVLIGATDTAAVKLDFNADPGVVCIYWSFQAL